jgi:hypothetical protein
MLGQLNRSLAEVLTNEEVVPTSRTPWASLCPPSLGRMGVKIEASTRCCKELSAYRAVVVLRMIFSHGYTSPTPSVEGVGNVPKSAATTAMLWLALTGVGSCRSARSIAMVRPTSSADSHWCKWASLASVAARSSASSPHRCADLC